TTYALEIPSDSTRAFPTTRPPDHANTARKLFSNDSRSCSGVRPLSNASSAKVRFNSTQSTPLKSSVYVTFMRHLSRDIIPHPQTPRAFFPPARSGPL